MQTTLIPAAAKKHWTVPTITAVRSSSTAEASKLLNATETVSIVFGDIMVNVGPTS